MPVIYIKDYDTEVEIPEGANMAAVQAALQKQFPSKNLQQKTISDLIKPGIRDVQKSVEVLKNPPGGEVVVPSLGAAAGLALTGMNPIGGAGGYFLGKQLERGGRGKISTPSQQIGDISDAMLQEIMGPLAQKMGKPIAWTAKKIGKGVRQFLGATTGAGPGTMEEALKGGESFKEAMRGKVSGEEIVENVKGALQAIKEQRSGVYRKQLEEFSKLKGALDITPIVTKLDDLMQSYKVNVKYKIPDEYAWAAKNPKVLKQLEASGAIEKELDFSGSKLATDKNAQGKVKEIFDVITNWKNKTPEGIDTLKQALDNEYSENSLVRQFVASIRGRTKDVLVSNVPKYAEMTKGYSEATNFIKDVEKGLMLKKGQTVDQTLRRLTSTMRENFEMRRDLVNALGSQAGEDLAGQIAGYSANQIIPRGLVGKLFGGGVGVVMYINPKFWPLLVASSPKAVGEFLNIYGKGLREAGIAAPATYKTLAIGAMNQGGLQNE